MYKKLFFYVYKCFSIVYIYFVTYWWWRDRLWWRPFKLRSCRLCYILVFQIKSWRWYNGVPVHSARERDNAALPGTIFPGKFRAGRLICAINIIMFCPEISCRKKGGAAESALLKDCLCEWYSLQDVRKWKKSLCIFCWLLRPCRSWPFYTKISSARYIFLFWRSFSLSWRSEVFAGKKMKKKTEVKEWLAQSLFFKAPLSEQNGTKRSESGNHWSNRVLLCAFFWRPIIILYWENSRDRTVLA